MGRFHNTHTNTSFKIWNITGLSEFNHRIFIYVYSTFSLEADKTKICIEIPKITKQRDLWSYIHTCIHTSQLVKQILLYIGFSLVNGNAISQKLT